jgi:L-alanine-DL-glutamate epimerase-like enolase superfamily enzyme
VSTIVRVGTRLRRIPLTRPWGPDVTAIHVIAVDVHDSDGGVGHGFSWTPSIGARAVLALLDDHLVPAALGRDADPAIWSGLWEHAHEAGGGGVTTIALAGIDLALWDLRARRAGAGIPELLGRRHERQPAYGSGVNLHYSIDDLVAQVLRWVAAGFSAVKIKVGKPDPAEDLDRLLAVREALGSERSLMIDANQRWDVDRAATALALFEAVDPLWIEEPLRADDLAGHRELRTRTGIPIALGENVHTVHRFRDFLDAGVVDVVQPNVVRVGGITPFLTIADLARSRGVTLAPHLLPELSAQLAFALPERTWVEDV